ncbi:MAG: hypothetical protein HYX89_06090 [Chloroflexi bacterium]|nr:hypothetical protein [Chloroflexota bacterium]
MHASSTLGVVLWLSLAAPVALLLGNFLRFAANGPQTVPEASARLSIQPVTATIPLGTVVTVALRLDGAVNVWTVDMAVTFTAGVIAVEDADSSQPGVQITPGNFPDPQQGVVSSNEVDNALGLIHYRLDLQPPATPAEGGGTVAWVAFRGLAAGESLLRFDPGRTRLYDPAAQALPYVADDGLLIVVSPTPTPTSSPTPTATATITKLLISPSFLQLPTGTEGSLAVQVADAVDLYRVEIGIAFDPLILHGRDADPAQPGVQIRPGDFFDPGRSLVRTNSVDNQLGRITYSVELIPPAPPAGGNGTLAEVLFLAQGVGASDIVIASSRLYDFNARPVPHETSGGRVAVITGTPIATATMTPTVSSSPSPTPPLPTATPTMKPTEHTVYLPQVMRAYPIR